jgi:hypothetical protein
MLLILILHQHQHHHPYHPCQLLLVVKHSPIPRQHCPYFWLVDSPGSHLHCRPCHLHCRP